MTTTPTFEELFRDCQQTAVHLEMRDAYMKSNPAFIDWKAGQDLDPAERWADWHTPRLQRRPRQPLRRRRREHGSGTHRCPEVAKLCESAFETVWQRATPHAQFEWV
ncbi:DUF6879 family protein [Streptomyces sp. NPDC007984]|uniref:DUF6879 family protein n=1 Tax=Streptomyces sp. NPDC007984 TaxID=3364801 RepID=UPI0036E104A1